MVGTTGGMSRRPGGQVVDDAAEVAALLNDDTQPGQTAGPAGDGGAYLPGGAHIPVRPLDATAQWAALVTIADHATGPDDCAELVEMLGLVPALATWHDRPKTVLEPDEVPPACAHPDVFTAWDERGRAYAVCGACSGEWRGGPCVGCGLPVRADHVARTGVVVHDTGHCRTAAGQASQQEDDSDA